MVRNILAIEAVSKRYSKVARSTIYNKVPDLNVPSQAALGMFNEVILEELSSREIPIIELSVLVRDEQDYSAVSETKTSVHGGRRNVLQN